MAGFGLEAVKSNVTDSVTRMTNAQRATLGAAFVGVVIMVFAVSRLAGQVPMRSAYTNLDATQASEVVDQIRSQGIAYELVDNGRTIRVPDDQVDAVRLAVAAQGITVSSQDGWGILDDQGITSSNFQQRVGYQRAMQGELEKTIENLDGVQSADVHLVMPEDDLFTDDDIMASAAVVVNTGSSSLNNEQVTAIVNLVASAVEGMTAAAISVTDSTGRVLHNPGDDPMIGLEGDSQLRMAQQWETALERDIEAMLSMAVGAGRADASVKVEMDFDQSNVLTTTYEAVTAENGSQIALNESSRHEVYGGDDEAQEVGVLTEETSAIDDETSAVDTDSTSYLLDTMDNDFAVNQIIAETRKAPGEIRSLSVAVLVDESAADAEVLAELEALVAGIAAIDPERGDTLQVSFVPFNEEVSAAIVEEAEAEAAAVVAGSSGGLDIPGLVRMVVTALIGMVVLLKGLKALRAGAKREVVDSAELLSATAGAPALPEGSTEGEDGEIIVGPTAEEHLSDLISNQPDEVAGLLRSWLKDEVSV